MVPSRMNEGLEPVPKVYLDVEKIVNEGGRRILQHAEFEARRYGSAAIGPEHILLAIVEDGHSVGNLLLESFRVEGGRVRALLEGDLRKLASSSVGGNNGHLSIAPTEEAWRVLASAGEYAAKLNEEGRVAGEHLLYSLCVLGDGSLVERVLLDELGLVPENVDRRLRQWITPEPSADAYFPRPNKND